MKTSPEPGMEQSEPGTERSASAMPQSVSASYTAAPQEDTGTEGAPAANTGRFWSTRRVPAGLVALVLLGAAGLFLYDVSAVRADRPAMEWRRRLADELASRPLDDGWIIGGAAAAVVIGIWLLVLALTPGSRGLLPMRAGDVRAGLHRSAAALVLRDRAMEVPGVRSVRVEVTRRKVRARAESHFRELDEVRADLDEALGEGIRRLGLVRPLALSVHVRRPSKR